MSYNIMGFTIRGTSNYTAVPGLKLWLNGRVNKNVNISGKVLTWTDIDGIIKYESNIASAADNGVDYLLFDNIPFVTSKYLRRFDNYKFLYSGSPFGVYFIFKIKKSGTGNIAGSYLLNTGLGVDLVYQLRTDTNLNRINARVLDEGVAKWNFNTPNNSLSYDTLLSMGNVRTHLSNANNIQIWIDNALSAQLTSSGVSRDLAHSDPVQIGRLVASWETELTLHEVVIYDWTGYTESQVNLFNTAIINAQQISKQTFI
jgi:hypothetical protein